MSRGDQARSGPIGDDELAQIFAPLEGRPLALAVSGGADSMALMHLAARWLRLGAPSLPAEQSPPVDERSQTEKPGTAVLDWIGAMDGDLARRPPVVVLTVDHGLREAAAREAEFVRSSAQRLGFPCAILRWAGDKPATGLQDAARHARRALMAGLITSETAALEAVCGARAAPRLLVMAHHLEDQAETVLMRLGRGSGLDGLKGMAADTPARERCDGGGDDGACVRIARPLLAIPKRRLVETLAAERATWVDDPSNEDVRFERVRVRKALETLSDLGIGAEMIALSARRLADASEWINFVAREEGGETARFVQPVEWHGGVYAEVVLPDTPNFDVPRYAAVRTLRQALRSFGGEGREPELRQLETLVAIIKSNYAALPDDMTLGGCRLVFVARARGGRRLTVFREGAGAHSPVAPCAPGGVVAWDGGRFTITAAPDAPPGCVVRALGIAGWADLKRRVPELAALGWPAAAAATLPVMEVGGDIVHYAGVVAALEGCTTANEGVRAALRSAGQAPNERFAARFHPMPW